ncbi:MAG: hypothetical protein ACKON9_23865 [Planctomycetaceae bacterium]
MAVKCEEAGRRTVLSGALRGELAALQKSRDPQQLAAIARLLDGSVRRELRPAAAAAAECAVGPAGEVGGRGGGEAEFVRLVTRPAASVAGDSVRSRRYLQRKLWRLLRQIRQQDAGQYLAVCEVLLSGYEDAALSDGVALLDSYVLMHVLFHDSPVVCCSSSGWGLAPGRTLSELQWSPAYRDVWAGSAEMLWRLVTGAGSRVVRRWAALGLGVVGISQLRVEQSALAVLFGRSDPADVELGLGLLLNTGFVGSLTLSEALHVLAGLPQSMRAAADVGELLLRRLGEPGVGDLLSEGVLQAMVLLLPYSGPGLWAWEQLQGRGLSGLDWLLPLLDCGDERIGREVQERVNERLELCAEGGVWLRLLQARSGVAAAWQLRRISDAGRVLAGLLSASDGAELISAMWGFWQRAVEQRCLPLGFRRLALQQAAARVRVASGEQRYFEALLGSALGSGLQGLRNSALQWQAVGVTEGWLAER